MMTTTQEQIEWLEGEKPFFDKKVRDMYSDIQRKLRAAEDMAEALRFYSDAGNISCALRGKTSVALYEVIKRHHTDVSGEECFGYTAQQSLKKWEGNNAN